MTTSWTRSRTDSTQSSRMRSPTDEICPRLGRPVRALRVETASFVRQVIDPAGAT